VTQCSNDVQSIDSNYIVRIIVFGNDSHDGGSSDTGSHTSNRSNSSSYIQQSQ